MLLKTTVEARKGMSDFRGQRWLEGSCSVLGFSFLGRSCMFCKASPNIYIGRKMSCVVDVCRMTVL